MRWNLTWSLFEDSSLVLMQTLSRVTLARLRQYRCAAMTPVPVPSTPSDTFRKWWKRRWSSCANSCASLSRERRAGWVSVRVISRASWIKEVSFTGWGRRVAAVSATEGPNKINRWINLELLLIACQEWQGFSSCEPPACHPTCQKVDRREQTSPWIRQSFSSVYGHLAVEKQNFCQSPFAVA